VLLHRDFHRAGPPVEVDLCSEGSEGSEALAKLLTLEAQARLPDLVVCDLNMDKMDGLTLLEALADRPALAAIRAADACDGVHHEAAAAARAPGPRGGLVDILIRARPVPL
jgi:CheY-like chemotaxis protein